MSYSDGKQYSRSRIIPCGARRRPPRADAVRAPTTTSTLSSSPGSARTATASCWLDDNEPWWDHAATRNPYGLFDMNRDRTETSSAAPGYWASELFYYDRYADGFLSDDERDEDADGLTNFDETHGRMTLTYWAGCYTMEKPWHIAYAPTSHVDRDTDGDGVIDGADDSDFDDIPNVMELSRNARLGPRRHRQRPRVQAPEPAAAADGLLASDRLRPGQPVQPLPAEPPVADLPAPGQHGPRRAVRRLAELVLAELDPHPGARLARAPVVAAPASLGSGHDRPGEPRPPRLRRRSRGDRRNGSTPPRSRAGSTPRSSTTA